MTLRGGLSTRVNTEYADHELGPQRAIGFTNMYTSPDTIDEILNRYLSTYLVLVF